MTIKTLTVLVPKPGTRPARVIDAGSGIVTNGSPRADGIEVYYEGNRFGAENLQRFEERVLHAAGRLAQQYPTIARGVFAREDFEDVGTFVFREDWQTHRLTITNDAVLQPWLTEGTPQ